jgi:hypothetical protein
MNTLYSVPNDPFWKDVITNLRNTFGLVPKIWLFDNINKETGAFDECAYITNDDAQNLRNRVKCHNTKKSSLVPNNIDQFSLLEYYNFLKIFDRNRQNIGFVQRDRFFKEQIRYWVNILISQNIQSVIFSNIPHLRVGYPLYLSAKKLNLKIAFFNFTAMKGVCYLKSDIDDDINFSQKWDNTIDVDIISQKINKSVKDSQSKEYEPYYMLRQKRYDKKYIGFRQWYFIGELFAFKTQLRFLIHQLTGFDIQKKISKRPLHEIKQQKELSPFKSLQYYRKKKHFLKKLFLNYQKTVTAKPDLDLKYIFVALHYQPEASSAPSGNLFADQIYLIELLSDHLPAGWKIYVKEHSSQFSNMLNGEMGRYLSYYDDISRIDSVEIVDIDFSTQDLISKCQFVSTITGTVGWEGLIFGKPCLLFGNAWYSSCPGVIKIVDPTEIPTAFLDYQQLKTQLEIGFEKYLKKFSEACLNVDLYNQFKGEVPQDPEKTSNYIAHFLQFIQTCQSE